MHHRIILASFLLSLSFLVDAGPVWPPAYWIKRYRPWRYNTGCGFEKKRHHDSQVCDLTKVNLTDFKQGASGMRYYCHRYFLHFSTKHFGGMGTPIGALRGLYLQQRTPPTLHFGHRISFHNRHESFRMRWEYYDCHDESSKQKRYQAIRCAHKWCLHRYAPLRPGLVNLNSDAREKYDLYDTWKLWDVIDQYWYGRHENPWAREFILSNVTLPNAHGNKIRCRRIKQRIREHFVCYSDKFRKNALANGLTRPKVEKLTRALWDFLLTNFSDVDPHHGYPDGFFDVPANVVFAQKAYYEQLVRHSASSHAILLARYQVFGTMNINPRTGVFPTPMTPFSCSMALCLQHNTTLCAPLDLGMTFLCFPEHGEDAGWIQGALEYLTLPSLLNFVRQLQLKRDSRLIINEGPCNDLHTNEYHNVPKCADDDYQYYMRQFNFLGKIVTQRLSVRFLMYNGFRLACPALYWYPAPFSKCYPGRLVEYQSHVFKLHDPNLHADLSSDLR